MRRRGPVHGEVKFAIIALCVLMLAQESPSNEVFKAEPTQIEEIESLYQALIVRKLVHGAAFVPMRRLTLHAAHAPPPLAFNLEFWISYASMYNNSGPSDTVKVTIL